MLKNVLKLNSLLSHNLNFVSKKIYYAFIINQSILHSILLFIIINGM